ncbi:MAG: ABC transporter ATP-binding protein [Gemmatimonadota bacterium]|nr:ABC transporter ATP-binding protein [Gemmatimonadota bacterium]
MSAAVEVRGLGYKAGKTFEIRDLDLTIPTGAIYGFLGANGAGKTTTIRLIMGLLRPLAGTISVVGHRVPDESPSMLARVGYVPERPHVYKHLTVDEAMRFHRAFHVRWDETMARELMEQFMLDPTRPIARLSKGETGKLLMLLALAQRPDVLVLDEPTDGLDPVVRRDVLTALLDFVARDGASVLVSSHLVHELERMCDWVGVMDRGRLLAEMPMHAFKSGIKRIRLENAPAMLPQMPFVLVERDTSHRDERWLVRGWQAPMTQYFDGIGARVIEVVDLDLEEGFVELLRAGRDHRAATAGAR